MDKIIKILEKIFLSKRIIPLVDRIKQAAQEIHNLRFQTARQVIEEYNRTAHITKDGEPLIGTVRHLEYWLHRRINNGRRKTT